MLRAENKSGYIVVSGSYSEGRYAQRDIVERWREINVKLVLVFFQTECQ